MNDLAEGDAREICVWMNLGTPVATPMPVSGGLLHRMWRLETTTGVFAVKGLNPEVIGRPGVPDVYRASERIARAVAAAGLPAVPAIQLMGDPLLTLADRSVLVFPWIDGHTLPEASVMASDARRIGALLGGIHTLDLDAGDLEPPDGAPPDVASWNALFKRAAELRLAWARESERRVDELAGWTRTYEAGRAALPPSRVVSHRDLDPKNVLWDDEGEPRLIDWESAGPVSPAVELAGAALAWSGQRIGPASRDAFAALIEGYRGTGPALEAPPRAALASCLGDWLDWLHYNARRALGDTGAEAEERELGSREASSALDTMRGLAAGIEGWAGWLDDGA